MRVQTFVGKLSMEALHQMTEHINDWLAHHNVEPKFIKQSFGYEKPREASREEPVIVITVWY
jgi:hypothetical protein